MSLKHTVAIITGANRGFGRAIAHALANRCVTAEEQLSLILVGRNEEGLDMVQMELKLLDAERVTSWCVVSDLEAEYGIEVLWESVERALESAQKVGMPITHAHLINNAGSTGPISKRVAEYDLTDILQYVPFNFVSFTVLCSSFLKYFQSRPKAPGSFPSPALIITNISSLLAVKAFPYWGLYASGKAARDQLLQVIALEEAKNGVKTLSYAPGPLDNEMQKSVRETLGDPQQKILYTGMFENNSLVTMDVSADKLVNLLWSNEFTSGAHVDFYDTDI